MRAEVLPDVDLERRFGGLRRLYGDAAYEQLRRARMAVIGVGGVGSWAAEALARCGVAELVLVDLDHVSESNVNRQVQALGATLGRAKVQALAERIADIHPGCRVHMVEAFVDAGNWPTLLPTAVDVVIDACDQASAKLVLAAWAIRTKAELVCVGAAGGKRKPQAVQSADLAEATHDPLLASLRQRLRKQQLVPRNGAIGVIGVRAVFSREPVAAPAGACDATAGDGSLNCHGYGSTVTVTASFGMLAAQQAIDVVVARAEHAAARGQAAILAGFPAEGSDR